MPSRRYLLGRSTSGFSLIEMLVTVGIISILLASAIGVYVWAPEKARRSKMVAEMEVFHKAAIRYHAKFSGWPRKLNDLNGLGVLRIPRDPWGGKYRLEEEYYITCRPPSGDPYRIPLCPRIFYNFTGGFYWEPVLVNPQQVKEEAIKKAISPINARVRLRCWPRPDIDLEEFRINSGGLSIIPHSVPSNIVFFGRPTDGLYDSTSSQIVYDDDFNEYAVRTGYKFLLCQSAIYNIYFYDFGNTDGDIDLDRKPEVRVAYEEDNMVVYDINEEVDGIDKDYLESRIQSDIKSGMIWYNLQDVMILWNPDYHCRWSVSH